ncbi:MAG: PD-(D/E)XK nuclease family protein [Planctomycetes bacterium]|nr:PD-(D/E)XK nuclease family protein [Planctomycetota bacterium]
MIWSFSAHRTFRKCPRQWFFKKIYAHARAKDPLRREAHRLSKLEGIQAWRGKLVDTVISETIVPSISRKHPCGLDEAKKIADQLFALQRAQRMAPAGQVGFFEAEYHQPLTEKMFDGARLEIHTALENFYRAEPVWKLLQQAKALVRQRPLSFRHGTVSIRVVPDLITFQSPLVPAVLDWKVNAYPMRDYWLQLVTGAIGVTRCNPHRDWPSGATQHEPHEVQLLEVQLLTGDVRFHTLSEADVHDADDFIAISASEMELACGGSNPKDLQPEDFPVASDPKACQTCAFKKLCWGAET